MLCIGQLNLSNNTKDLYVQKTRVGWIVGGTPCSDKGNKNQVDCPLVELQKLVANFWEIEDGQNLPYFLLRRKGAKNIFFSTSRVTNQVIMWLLCLSKITRKH